MNPGFSSTPGVHISLARFKSVHYNAAQQLVTIGAGQTWDQVYAILDPLNVTGKSEMWGGMKDISLTTSIQLPAAARVALAWEDSLWEEVCFLAVYDICL
jgi:hypothetical protein